MRILLQPLFIFGFLFRAGLAEHTEHILLVRLDAGLVEGIDAEERGGHRTGVLKEVDKLAEMVLIRAVRLDVKDMYLAEKACCECPSCHRECVKSAPCRL